MLNLVPLRCCIERRSTYEIYAIWNHRGAGKSTKTTLGVFDGALSMRGLALALPVPGFRALLQTPLLGCG